MGIAIALIVTALIAGGASREDVPGQILVQFVAVATGAAMLILAPQDRIARARPALWFGVACLAVPALQLVPLPPDLWATLPGHDRFAAAVRTADVTLGWHPLSLTPELTLASLLGLLVPFAGMIVTVGLSRWTQPLLLSALVLGALASAVLGLAQLGASSPMALHFYSVTNPGSEVGFFANRNHQAALLAISLPMIATWITLFPGTGLQRLGRQLIASLVALFMTAMAIATGSRAGLVLVLIGALSGALLLLTGRKPRSGPSRIVRRDRLVVGAVGVLGLVLLGAVLFARRDALMRLASTDVADEQRLAWITPVMQMVRDFFPFGSGLGSFASVYRAYEPFDLLQTTYLNHAHNDLLEIASDTGVAGLVLLAIFLLWWVVMMVRVWRSREDSPRIRIGRLGGQIILMLLLASLPDYPLRTPLLALIFAVSAAWLLLAGRPQEGQSERAGFTASGASITTPGGRLA
jgi:O-antigen ligase